MHEYDENTSYFLGSTSTAFRLSILEGGVTMCGEVASSFFKARRVNGDRRSDLQSFSDGGVSMSLRFLFRSPFL